MIDRPQGITAVMAQRRERASVGVALLLRTQWLESEERYRSIFRDNPQPCSRRLSSACRYCAGGGTRTPQPQPPIRGSSGCATARRGRRFGYRQGAEWHSAEPMIGGALHRHRRMRRFSPRAPRC